MTFPNGRAVRFTFELGLPERRARTRVWVPLPLQGPEQSSPERTLDPANPSAELVKLGDGDRALTFQVGAGGPLSYAVTYAVRRSPVKVEADAAERFTAPPGEDGAFAAYLAATRKVPIDGPVVAQARTIASAEEPPLQAARKLFEHLLSTLSYDAGGCTPERSHALGDLQGACDLRQGTCTEFHGLFVARMRALGHPARFVFGFNLPKGKREGRILGYHCWAEVALPSGGWFPVDVSEEWKLRASAEGPGPLQPAFFGALDASRIAFTHGRDVRLPPTGEEIDRLIFPYASAEGVEIPLTLGFRFAETG